MSLSCKFGSLPVKLKPFPAPSVRRNVAWAMDSWGRWQGADRGAEGDFFDAKVTVFGTKAEMEAFADWAEEHGREEFAIDEIDGVIFAPLVMHTAPIQAVITDRERLKRVFFSSTDTGVDEVTFTLRAVDPGLWAPSEPGFERLLLQDQFEQDKSTTVFPRFSGDGVPFIADRQFDAGRFVGEFIQDEAGTREALRYLLYTKRAESFDFPTLPGVTYPFGKARGGLPKLCKVTDLGIARPSLRRWALRITFVEYFEEV